MTDVNSDPVEVAQRQDRLPLSRLHVAALLLCCLGLGFDLLEIGLGNALLAVFTAPPHSLDARQLSWLLASVYVGAIIGASLMGQLADRFGRRRLLGLVLGLLCLTSMLAAVSPGPTSLAWARGASGVALGAFPPLMVVYLTDILPPHRRGVLIFSCCAVASLGAPAGILLVRFLGPLQPFGLESWRWAFVLGSLGAGTVGLLIRRLPESPRWLATAGRTADASAVVAAFERSPVLWARASATNYTSSARPASASLQGARGIGLLATLYFLAAWSTVAFPLLSGAVLAAKGFALSDTLLFVGLAMFGPVLGNLLVAPVIDHVERRTSLTICAAGMLASGTVFTIANSAPALVAANTVFTLLASVYVPILNVYGAESVAANSRASAVTGAWTFNRIGAALGPLLLLPLLGHAGAQAMFGVIASSLLLTLIALYAAPKGDARRSVG